MKEVGLISSALCANCMSLKAFPLLMWWSRDQPLREAGALPGRDPPSLCPLIIPREGIYSDAWRWVGTEKSLPRTITSIHMQFVTEKQVTEKKVTENLADGYNKVRSAQLSITNRRGLSCVSSNFPQLVRTCRHEKKCLCCWQWWGGH